MDLRRIVASKAIRFFAAESGGVYMPDAAALLKEKFRFMRTPETVEDFQDSEKRKFMHGTFEGIVIDSLEVHPDGVVVDTKANTRISDEFINEMIDLVTKELNFSLIEMPNTKRAYVSEVEVFLDKELHERFERFNAACKKINDTVSGYADSMPPFQPTGLIIDYDRTASPHLSPHSFILDRRRAASFDTQIYYSIAPLPTNVHLEVIAEIEKAL